MDGLRRIRMDVNLGVAMDDGVVLATDVYLPTTQSERFPAILIRTPYSKNVEHCVRDAVYFAQRGYGVVVQDVRGRWESEGSWYPFKYERADGQATVRWIVSQPWCSGVVGGSGFSYEALTQWMTAIGGPSEFKAIVPRVSFSSLFHNWVFTGGAFQLAFNLRWGAVQMHSRTNQRQYNWMPSELHYDSLFAQLPLESIAKATGRTSTFYQDWLENWVENEFWLDLGDLGSKYDQIDVAAYDMAGWYDVFCQGSINNYVGTTKGKGGESRSQKLVIGPWIHSLGERGLDPKTGEVDFGPSVRIDLLDEECRWFDYWLKNIPNGIVDEPQVRYFVMGRNEWRTADQWPPPEVHYADYFLSHHAGVGTVVSTGNLLESSPERSKPDRYVYDPEDPVPTVGGSTCCSELITPVSMGPRDQSEVELREDVLLYVTSPLVAGLEIAGPVTVTLFASSSARDTDFTAKLVDLHPDGTAINIAQGILRARFRDSFEAPTLLEPGRIYEFVIDCWSTSAHFAIDHRIGIEISSSNFPQFDRNLNTGLALGFDKNPIRAHQTIYHDRDHPSRATLPVVPVPSSDATHN